MVVGLRGPGHVASLELGRKEPEAHHPHAGKKQHLLIPTSHLLPNKSKYLKCERKEGKEGGREEGIITWKET